MEMTDALKQATANVSEPLSQAVSELPAALKRVPIEREDVVRWLVFTAFWGSIFYVYTCIGQIIGTRRKAVRVNLSTMGLGYALHVLTFVTGGSTMVALGSIISGQRSTKRSAEQISGGELERGWARQALGGTLGSTVPFALALVSQYLASRRTNKPVVDEQVNLAVAGGAMVALSGLTALAVARITAWVAQDAKSR